MSNLVDCKFAITRDGAPITGKLLITGIGKTVAIDLFSITEQDHTHIITIKTDLENSDKLVESILDWI